MTSNIKKKYQYKNKINIFDDDFTGNNETTPTTNNDQYNNDQIDDQVNNASVNDASVNDASVNDASVNDASVNDASVNDAPVDAPASSPASNDRIKAAPKKRGRKPKLKQTVKKAPKRRGRKPTGKIVNLPVASMEVNNEDNIIVHLPLCFSEINDDSDTSDNTITKKQQPKIKRAKIQNELDITGFHQDDELNTKKYNKKIDDLTKLVEKLQTQILENESADPRNKPVNAVNTNFIDVVDGTSKWTNKTDISCWWCCHKFENIPCAIPDKYYDDQFYVFGCFCSLNCAMAYNNDINDYKVWERNSLLELLSKKINSVDYKLISAPPRQSLEMFGGNLSINEFRVNSNIISYRYILPPMISIIPLIEQDSKIRQSNNMDNSLKLKRKKPLTTLKYSLNKTMNLKKISL
jgi:hypothetical protein